MNFFLKLKHWQVFFLVILLPIFCYIAFISLVVNNLITMSDLNIDIVISIARDNGLKVLPLLIFAYLCNITLFLSMGLGFQYKLTYNNILHKVGFVVALIVPYLVSIGSIYIIGHFYLDIFNDAISQKVGDQEAFPDLMKEIHQNATSQLRFLGPINFLNLISFGFVYYTIAKALKSAETNKEAEIGDFAIEMVWLYLYFIGVWILQPRFNEIVKNKDSFIPIDKKESDQDRFKPKLDY